MLAAASELDLVHGGYFRARPSLIQFYGSPENAPDGWSDGFPDGSPDTPRALVGQAEAARGENEDEVVVRLTVSNWQAVRDVKRAFERGDYRGRFQEYVMAQESALRGRKADRRWLREQLERLRAHAGGALLG